MLQRHLASCLFCLLPLTPAAFGDNADPRTEPPLVRVTSVQNAATASRSFTGVVAARVQSDLGFRVSGKVLERLVDTGQSVQRGQPLMRIDPVDLGLQAKAQKEAVAAAQVHARQTADDEARYRDLVAAGAVSASAYGQIKAAADAARAQLKAAEAQASVAGNASSYAVLLADADGVVVATHAEPGQVVTAGQPVIRLARAGQREAVVYLPETLRPAVGSSAQATLYGDPHNALPARLRLLSDAADPLTRTYEARYILEGVQAQAPLGATVTVAIPAGNTSASAVQVPIGALFDAGSGPGVWAVAGDPATTQWHPVTILSLSDETAQVESNLPLGAQIVALGAHLLREGEQVRMLSEGSHSVAGGRP
ncbi:efflux RND transporter periplasmic adaptor subunit [Pokkaliibacter sp. MBI-7]|uniref:efflux RND transporter periplasmic adaptor subunit n=1 Tax=Pokkaliibacter sp. MBI-7 TaxID=3040600 RepID=UPI00244A94E6|nr:efflux RND transporter periplasmic adaptor subunit [Pokkaliibacter sp. MBI-7]MDH2432053.1 efflux RND transporter periplasmic adaptor subunit [Pokkaliibacter sp. MBI-7]